jgi:glycosyltransferase involved in cell wall biosynthesis
MVELTSPSSHLSQGGVSGARKTILYVYDGDWPYRATRVGKQTRSLARAGHRVVLISRNDLAQPRIEETSWMTVRRLPSVRRHWLNRLINFPFFFNPIWYSAIMQSARESRADYILVRDLPLAPTALAVGARLGVPVVYDMAEVYPEFLQDRFDFGRASLSDYFVKNPRAARLIERFVLPRITKVIVVSEESRQRCLRLGADASRVVLVGNTPDDIEMISASVRADVRRPDAESCTLLFVGILMWDRGVAEAVRAMPTILKAYPKTTLAIVGDGDERGRIERVIAECGLSKNVELLGYREHSSLPALYARADIGLLPFLPGRHVKITLANKLFDYMAAGLPIVAADLAPMRRILGETGAGELFAPGDPDSLAEVVIGVLRDPARREELGKNGRRAALEKYHWGEDERRLIEIFADHGSAIQT